jgi:hypothetical protein
MLNLPRIEIGSRQLVLYLHYFQHKPTTPFSPVCPQPSSAPQVQLQMINEGKVHTGTGKICRKGHAEIPDRAQQPSARV